MGSRQLPVASRQLAVGSRQSGLLLRTVAAELSPAVEPGREHPGLIIPKMGSQLPRPPAKSCGDLGGLDGELGLKRIHMPRALDPLGSLEPSGLPICQPSQVIPK